MARPLRTSGPFEVHNDPEVGAHWFDLPPVDGDVVTPSVLTVADDGAGVWRVVSARRRGDCDALPWIVQASAVTVVDADSVQVEGASGGHALRTREVSRRAGLRAASLSYPAAPRPKGRKKAPAVEVGSHDAPGRYHVFARIRKTVPDALAEVWLTHGEQHVENDRVRIETGKSLEWFYYYLGWIEINGGGGPLRHDPSTVGAMPVLPIPLALNYRDLDEQPGGVEIDHYAFMPADTETAWLRTLPTGVPARVVLDGINRRTYRLNPAGALMPGGSANHIGVTPLLGTKGQATRIFVLSGLHGGAPAPLDGTTEVTVEYRCLHRHVAPFTGGGGS